MIGGDNYNVVRGDRHFFVGDAEYSSMGDRDGNHSN